MHFAMKFIDPKTFEQRQEGINEINLMSFIDCDQVIKFQEAFYY